MQTAHDEKVAKKLVLERSQFSLVDGVSLLNEAHAGRFGGHLAEPRVYNRLRRDYWWNGLRGRC